MAFCVRCKKDRRPFVAVTSTSTDAAALAELLTRNGAQNVEIIRMESEIAQEFQLLMAEASGIG